MVIQVFLATVLDLYNNEVLAHSFSRRNVLELVFAMLAEMPSISSATLRSGQGFQYTHKNYQQKLVEVHLLGSHSRKGNCLDNGSTESFFSHLKTEALAGKPLCGPAETLALIEEHIRFQNTERFQKKLGQLSPVEFREKLAA